MLIVWGNADSVNVQKVLWCCEEMGIAYLRIDAGRHFGVVNTPEFRELNPNGLVPTINDDGFVLWESNAIVRYLTAKHAPGTLWPTDARARADADRWVDWSNSTLWPAMLPLFKAFMRTPEAQRDARVIEAARQQTIAVLEILDAQLKSSDFVGGTAFTMGDIATGCAVWRWMALPVERPQLIHMQRWFDTLATRAAYRKVVMQPLI
ncbi:MAG: glutathione S-transferase family protein [Pseudomonadota bacterium]